MSSECQQPWQDLLRRGSFWLVSNLDEVPEPLRQHCEEGKKRDEGNLQSLTIASKQKVSLHPAKEKSSV